MKWVKGHLPSWPEIFPVYSVIVFWAYSWYMLMFMFKLPSWLLEVPFGEIFAYFSYGVLLVFLDTIQLLAILVSVAFILPPAWFRNDFSTSGGALAGLLFAWIVFVQFSLRTLFGLPAFLQLTLLLVVILSSIVTVLVVRRLPFFRKIVSWFISSASTFVYLYGFLTAIGILVVLIRNLS